jgi:hypothetical protein
MADLQSYIILFLLWLVSTILVRAIFHRTKTKARLPPSPMALPIIGHLHHLSALPHQALHKLSNRHGPLIHLFLGSDPYVIASSPEMAKEFLKTHKTFFSNRPPLAAVDYLTYGSVDFFFCTLWALLEIHEETLHVGASWWPDAGSASPRQA